MPANIKPIFQESFYQSDYFKSKIKGMNEADSTFIPFSYLEFLFSKGIERMKVLPTSF